MLSRKQKNNLAVLILTLLLTAPYLVAARGLVPCGGEGEAPCNIEHVFAILARVTNWLIMVAGIYAAYKIIGGGFNLIISMGNEEAITKNKKQITNAVLGFVFTLMAFMFVYTTLNILLRGVNGADPKKCAIKLEDPLSFLTVQDECGK